MVNVGSLIASMITEWELQYDKVSFQLKAKKSRVQACTFNRYVSHVYLQVCTVMYLLQTSFFFYLHVFIALSNEAPGLCSMINLCIVMADGLPDFVCLHQ